MGSDTVALIRPKLPLRLSSRSRRHLSRKTVRKRSRAPAIIPGKKPATTALAGNVEPSDVEGIGEPRAAGAVGGGMLFFLVSEFGIGLAVGVAVLIFAEEIPSADEDGERESEDDGDNTDLSSFWATHQFPSHPKPLGQHEVPQLTKGVWVSVLLIRLPGNFVASCELVSQEMGPMT
jgi:hypothetical protein